MGVRNERNRRNFRVRFFITNILCFNHLQYRKTEALVHCQSIDVKF